MFKIGMLNSIKLKTNVLIINAMAISLFFLLLLQSTIAQAEFVVMPDEVPDWAPAAAAAESVVDTHSEASAEAIDKQAGKNGDDKQHTATKPIEDLRTDSMHRDSMQRHSMPMPSMHMPAMNMPSAQNNAMQRNAPHWARHQGVHGQGARFQTMQHPVPPPPPGPYKSTALSEYSKHAHASGREQLEPKNTKQQNIKQGQMETGQTEPEKTKHGQTESKQKFNSAQVPMDVYSPERPWPENIRPANPWAPDYSRPSAATQYRMPANPAAMYNYPADRFYGYRQYPGMGAPDARSPYMQAPYMRHPQTQDPQFQSPRMQAPAYWPNMNSQGSNWMPSTDAGSRNPGAAYSPSETPYTERPYGY